MILEIIELCQIAPVAEVWDVTFKQGTWETLSNIERDADIITTNNFDKDYVNYFNREVNRQKIDPLYNIFKWNFEKIVASETATSLKPRGIYLGNISYLYDFVFPWYNANQFCFDAFTVESGKNTNHLELIVCQKKPSSRQLLDERWKR